MLSVEDARTQVLAAFTPLPAEVVSVERALGRVLAQDVAARVTQPPRDVSAMDGYAVRAQDVANAPITMRVVGEVPAGGDFDRPLGPGEAVRIFTGAPLPRDTDTVVIQENTARDGDQVTVQQAEPKGRWVRPAGLDFQAGSVGLTAGRQLSARDIGLAAAMNRPWLSVRRKPRVVVLATGNEIVLPGEELGPSQIVSSNGYALSAFVAACGGEPLHLGVAPDTKDGLRQMLAGAAQADLLLTSGGVSVGEHDLVQDVLTEMGADLGFWKIAMELERIALSDSYFVEKKLFPNVDFYSGIILKAMGFPSSMFTVLFALARTVGWVAQWKEMIEDPGQKISRPRQLYTGYGPRDFVPQDQRD